MSSVPQREYAGAIPDQLQDRQQWIVTVDSRPIESQNQPDNQYSFERACRLSKQHAGKPAYVLHESDPFLIFDLDDVVRGGGAGVSSEAVRFVDELNTYTEWSQSLQGLHLVCLGSRLPNRKQSGPFNDIGKVEAFDADQYIILTGYQISGYTGITDGSDVNAVDDNPIYRLQREYLDARDRDEGIENVEATNEYQSTASTDLTPADIERTLEEYASEGYERAAETLQKWQSVSGSSLGFQSASEADLSFASDLTFWCCDDRRLVDDCFRASNRMRPKWDEVHYSDGRTYGEAVVDIAVKSNYDTFSGHHVHRA